MEDGGHRNGHRLVQDHHSKRTVLDLEAGDRDLPDMRLSPDR